jgi:hypothetical protein
VDVAAKLDCNAAALSEAMRNGGLSLRVPGTFDVAVVEVPELDPPQAANSAAPRAALSGQ